MSSRKLAKVLAEVVSLLVLFAAGFYLVRLLEREATVSQRPVVGVGMYVFLVLAQHCRVLVRTRSYTRRLSRKFVREVYRSAFFLALPFAVLAPLTYNVRSYLFIAACLLLGYLVPIWVAQWLTPKK